MKGWGKIEAEREREERTRRRWDRYLEQEELEWIVGLLQAHPQWLCSGSGKGMFSIFAFNFSVSRVLGYIHNTYCWGDTWSNQLITNPKELFGWLSVKLSLVQTNREHRSGWVVGGAALLSVSLEIWQVLTGYQDFFLTFTVWYSSSISSCCTRRIELIARENCF